MGEMYVSLDPQSETQCTVWISCKLRSTLFPNAWNNGEQTQRVHVLTALPTLQMEHPS